MNIYEHTNWLHLSKKCMQFDVLLFSSCSLYSIPIRQPTACEEGACCVSHLPLLLCDQLADNLKVTITPCAPLNILWELWLSAECIISGTKGEEWQRKDSPTDRKWLFSVTYFQHVQDKGNNHVGAHTWEPALVQLGGWERKVVFFFYLTVTWILLCNYLFLYEFHLTRGVLIY